MKEDKQNYIEPNSDNRRDTLSITTLGYDRLAVGLTGYIIIDEEVKVIESKDIYKYYESK
jgi:hypothetical protein